VSAAQNVAGNPLGKRPLENRNEKHEKMFIAK
jgi:hypothetical protein